MKALIAITPILIVLGLARVESNELAPTIARVRGAVSSAAQCSNARMQMATAIADGEDNPASVREEPWSIELGPGRAVASLTPAPVNYCGRTVDGTLVTLSDGRRVELPGRARFLGLGDGTAEFVIS